ncbi:hypothetical protein KY290_022557 [Solanum tuberosum]|uniref:Uncharacterized protein n=1 Tax=Solanum tuberosum TaxID=4113 RepID=A0ABQ7V4P6_SOLTU|nr:hypothetical protein KY284_021461 [Solanum tuberosum]KAH0759064.1 hypothetical protein KY290_022557 [Solanum tuberosum]
MYSLPHPSLRRIVATRSYRKTSSMSWPDPTLTRLVLLPLTCVVFLSLHCELVVSSDHCHHCSLPPPDESVDLRRCQCQDLLKKMPRVGRRKKNGSNRDEDEMEMAKNGGETMG